MMFSHDDVRKIHADEMGFNTSSFLSEAGAVYTIPVFFVLIVR